MQIADEPASSLGISQLPQPLPPLQTYNNTYAQHQSLSTNPILAPRSIQHGQLPASCRLCRRRKVKCDRSIPCGNCTRAHVECVPSAPSQLPRGRNGGRKRRTDGELLIRIAKLERLVKNVEGLPDDRGMAQRRANNGATEYTEGNLSQVVDPDNNDQAKESSSAVQESRDSKPGLGLDRYMGSSFWITLSEEISGLKDVLGGPSDEEEDAQDGQNLDSIHSSSGREPSEQPDDTSFLFAPTITSEHPGKPTSHQLYTLCEVYLANVDPIFKVLHAPSLRRYLQEGAAELDCSPGPRGLGAVRFAVCYSATVSMTIEECRHKLGEEKSLLMARYRAGTESALAKADLVNTEEMSTLQALTIYLASVRVYDTRRFMWTLTSLAVRIAQAMNLHHESSLYPHRPFIREMRRRLWWQIYLLDSHAAEDRATNPVVQADSFSTKLPLRVNDEDLHVGVSDDIEERHEFTDMTFCMICHEIMVTSKQLNYVPAKEAIQPQTDSQERWTQRIDAVINAQRRIEERHLRHLDITRPFHWVTRIVADIVTANMWLSVYRPLQKRPYNHAPSQFADPGILDLSVEVLERTYQLSIDPAVSPFRWLAQTYVQWHALAVTVAQLCAETEGPTVERAWAIIMPVFKDASNHIADSSMGMLWRPIKKMMNRAQEVRKQYLESHSDKHNLSKRAEKWNLFDHCNHHMGIEASTTGRNEDTSAVSKGVTTSMQGLQSAPSIQASAPFDWDPWLAAASTSVEPLTQRQYSDDLSQTAWTNWESFVNGFQGEEEMFFSGQNVEAADFSRF